MTNTISWHVWLVISEEEQSLIQLIAKKHGHRRVGDVLLEAFRNVHQSEIAELRQSSFFANIKSEMNQLNDFRNGKKAKNGEQ